jgi:hypothetical protein
MFSCQVPPLVKFESYGTPHNLPSPRGYCDNCVKNQPNQPHPPASPSPAKMVCAPSTTAFMPLAHTLFTTVQGTLLGMPAFRAACVAGAWPAAQRHTQHKEMAPQPMPQFRYHASVNQVYAESSCVQQGPNTHRRRPDIVEATTANQCGTIVRPACAAGVGQATTHTSETLRHMHKSWHTWLCSGPHSASSCSWGVTFTTGLIHGWMAMNMPRTASQSQPARVCS